LALKRKYNIEIEYSNVDIAFLEATFKEEV